MDAVLVWTRRNLFRGPVDALITLIVAALATYVLYRLGRFVFVTGRWDVARENLALFIVGPYARDELWRPAFALIAVAGYGGLCAGYLRRRGVTPPIIVAAPVPNPNDPLAAADIVVNPALGGAGPRAAVPVEREDDIAGEPVSRPTVVRLLVRLWPLLLGGGLVLSLTTTVTPWLVAAGAVAAAAVGVVTGRMLPPIALRIVAGAGATAGVAYFCYLDPFNWLPGSFPGPRSILQLLTLLAFVVGIAAVCLAAGLLLTLAVWAGTSSDRLAALGPAVAVVAGGLAAGVATDPAGILPDHAAVRIASAALVAVAVSLLLGGFIAIIRRHAPRVSTGVRATVAIIAMVLIAAGIVVISAGDGTASGSAGVAMIALGASALVAYLLTVTARIPAASALIPVAVGFAVIGLIIEADPLELFPNHWLTRLIEVAVFTVPAAAAVYAFTRTYVLPPAGIRSTNAAGVGAMIAGITASAVFVAVDPFDVVPDVPYVSLINIWLGLVAVLVLGATFAALLLVRNPLASIVALGVFGSLAMLLLLTDAVGWDEWGGMMLNIFLAVISISLCFPLGVMLALGRRSRMPLIKAISTGYIELFRGVPLYVLLVMAGVPLTLFIPRSVTPGLVARAIIVFTLFTAAYVAEIVRGGLQSLPRGQTEAGQALGLPGTRVTALIVLPQALRNVIPAMVGQFISLFKDTTLAGGALAFLDLLTAAQIATRQEGFRGQGLLGETVTFVMLLFWVGSITMSRESQRLERKLGVGTR